MLSYVTRTSVCCRLGFGDGQRTGGKWNRSSFKRKPLLQPDVDCNRLLMIRRKAGLLIGCGGDLHNFSSLLASAQAFLMSEQFWEAKSYLVTDELICFVSGSFRFILGVQHSRVTSWTGVNVGSSMSLGEDLNPSRAVCLANHWQDRLPKLWPERHCY